jgi:DNA-binding CsgD family transcriptional regulator
MDVNRREEATLRKILLGRRLTEKEAEVGVEFFYSGDKHEIAARLHKDSSTIHSHIMSLYFKLDVHNRGDFIKYCYEQLSK